MRNLKKLLQIRCTMPLFIVKKEVFEWIRTGQKDIARMPLKARATPVAQSKRGVSHRFFFTT
jgi:hypothetical protein